MIESVAAQPAAEEQVVMAKKAPSSQKTVEALTHDEAKRKNIPTAEYQSVLQKERAGPDARRATSAATRDLDPQLVWRGKDEQDWSDLVVHAPPLYIQEKVHPKVLIDDLLRADAREREHEAGELTPDLFADFNGMPKGVDKTEFYQHDQNWSNRMILGDSLQVMASLAEREGLRGKVQCIYLDPPYGIKFNSNFQWSTTSRDVKDGNADHITREPEQVKAFRDTWRDGIHSYLTYLRDRLTVARDLLTDSGSIFVQIGDENVHRVRAVMDEVFGDENFVSPDRRSRRRPANRANCFRRSLRLHALVCEDRSAAAKYRQLYRPKALEADTARILRIVRDCRRQRSRLSTQRNVTNRDPLPRRQASIDSTITDLSSGRERRLQQFEFRRTRRIHAGKRLLEDNRAGIGRACARPVD